MLFRQFVDDDLGCASYLVGDHETSEAVVVDPAYAIERYLTAAEREGVRIVRVLETHTHADHVSGHGRLALEHGLPVSVHAADEPRFPFEALTDGDELQFGDVCIGVLHTPGHRPEHCCFTVADRARCTQPWLVLTGDSLFVGAAARPDLAIEATEGASDLYASLQRLLELDDGVEIYPGHVAGSLCGASMSSKPSSTIGFERRFNAVLARNDEQEFVDELTGDRTPRPPTLERVVDLNRGPFLGAPDELEETAAPNGELVIDVRAADAFAAGHIRGVINVPLTRSGFGTRAGFVLPLDEPLVLHASTPSDANEAARRLAAVGFQQLAGYVLHPPEATETIPTVQVDELERLLENDEIELVDVRELNERDDGYIPGSRHIPYRLLHAYEDELADGKPIVTICESGARAAVGASMLAAAGVDARPVIHGGIPDWNARGKSTVKFRRCGG